MDLNRGTAEGRLYPTTRSSVFIHEEDLRPWRATSNLAFTSPLLRIWDEFSGSQPIPGNGMHARDHEMRLDNAAVRKQTLAMHVDHSVWIAGPYISFTTSPKDIESMASFRKAKRGHQYLTVIDPNRRIGSGLPILDVEAEMKHYGILDPYGKGDRYYRDHYACLWQVPEAEIVGRWEWSELEGNANWYEEVI